MRRGTTVAALGRRCRYGSLVNVPTPRPTSSLRRQLALHYLTVTLTATVVGLVIATEVARRATIADVAVRHEAVAASLVPAATDLLAWEAPPAAFRAYLERPVLANDDEGTTITRSLPRSPHGSVSIVRADGTTWFPAAGVTPGPSSQDAVQSALRRGTLVHVFGALHVHTVAPLVVDADTGGTTVGALVLSSTVRDDAAAWAGRTVLTLAWAVPTIALLSIGFGLVASRPLTRRLRAIHEAAASWSAGTLTRTVMDTHDDELGVLARRLDRMAERLDLQRDVQRRAARDGERRRIARDLHDSVKQQVFAARLRLAAACDAPIDALRDHVRAVERWLGTAQRDLDGIVDALHGVTVEGRTCQDRVLDVVERWRGLGPDVEAVVDVAAEPSFEIAVTIERIVEEALANVVRHARAKRASVTVVGRSDEIEVDVVDDGVGLAAGWDASGASRRGIGLTSMRERAEDLGGRLHVGPVAPVGGTRATGTRLQATVPLPSHVQVPPTDRSRPPVPHPSA